MLAAQACGVTRKALLEARDRKAAFARHVAMYLLRLQGVSLSRVGGAFGGRGLSTVSHALRVIEDARDDPALDAQLDALEITLRRRLKGRATNGVEVPNPAE